MKRKMLLFTLALPVILCQNVQAQTTSSRLIGMAHLVNNGASFTPVDSSAYVYSGNRGGDLKHTLKYDSKATWNFLGDTAYNNAYMYLQTFDANNNITGQITEYWSGTSWVLSTNNLYFYSGTNTLDSEIQQIWGGTSWVPVAEDVYTYISGHLVEDEYLVWNGLTNSFGASSQKNYYYDPVSGNKINETDISWGSGVPVNTAEYSYTYTGTNQLATTTYSTWNGAGWDPSSKTSNTYDTTGNLTNTLHQTYSSATSTWVNTNMYSYSGFIGTTKNPSTGLYQNWDTAGGGQWDNVMQYSYAYNSTYNQLVSSIGESWNIVGHFEFALNDPKVSYYYETYNSSSSNVSVAPIAAGTDGANVYPVPAQNMLHVDLNWSKAQTASISIYDMTGRVVNEWTSDFGTQYFSAISVNHLASGTYFVKIIGAQGQQMVKQFVVAH